jgi:hypothetical protein
VSLAQRIGRRILMAMTGVDVLALQDSADREFRRAAQLESDLAKLRDAHRELRASLYPSSGTLLRWRGGDGVQS